MKRELKKVYKKVLTIKKYNNLLEHEWLDCISFHGWSTSSIELMFPPKDIFEWEYKGLKYHNYSYVFNTRKLKDFARNQSNIKFEEFCDLFLKTERKKLKIFIKSYKEQIQVVLNCFDNYLQYYKEKEIYELINFLYKELKVFHKIDSNVSLQIKRNELIENLEQELILLKEIKERNLTYEKLLSDKLEQWSS